MAHSTAASSAGETNYIVNGKILKLLKPSEIKEESAFASNLYTSNNATTVTPGDMTNNNNNGTNMGIYNQICTNQMPFVRIQTGNVQQVDSISMDGTPYTVIIPQQTGNSNNSTNGVGVAQQQQMQIHQAIIKYEPNDELVGAHTNIIVKGVKYAQQNNSTTNQSVNLKPIQKSKIHSTHSTNASVQRKRKPDKAGKGLRHFSMKVCEKVQEKGTTTYNEVADELVTEELKNAYDTPNCDQKNIRRRVYDALNVLMAMQIISKDKKEIRWIGLPTNSVEQCSVVEKDNEETRQRIKQKTQQLRELLLQQVSFKSLIKRNEEAEKKGWVPTPNSSIQLPFIIVNTHKSTKINCSVTNDKSEYIFKFDDKFEMHDDAEVLRRMGLLCGLDKGQCSFEDIERAKTLVPRNFEKYIEAYGNGKDSFFADSDEETSSYMDQLTNDEQGGSGGGDGGGYIDDDVDIDEEDEFVDNSDTD